MITLLPAASAANRFVVAELYTAQNCPYCAIADPQLGQVYEANKGSMAVISFHPLEYSGERDPMGISSTQGRMQNYGVDGYPTVVFDGGEKIVGGYEDVGDDYRSALSSRSSVSAPLKLRIGVINDDPTLKVWVNGTPEEDIFNDTELSVVLVQDYVEYDGANGLDEFRFVARGMRTKDVSVLDGEAFSKTFTFTVDPWPENLGVVAFVQDIQTGEIYQGAQKTVSEAAGPIDGTEDKGSGSEGLSTTAMGMIGLIAVLAAVGVYLFMDGRRSRETRSKGKVKRASRPRKKPAVKKVPASSGKPRQRGKKGRSKKRKRHR